MGKETGCDVYVGSEAPTLFYDPIKMRPSPDGEQHYTQQPPEFREETNENDLKLFQFIFVELPKLT
jgi:hypothetical protein